MNCNRKLCSLDEKQRGADCCAGTPGGMKGEIKRDRESREGVCGREQGGGRERGAGGSRFAVGEGRRRRG